MLSVLRFLLQLGMRMSPTTTALRGMIPNFTETGHQLSSTDLPASRAGGFFRGCAHHAPLPAYPIFLEACPPKRLPLDRLGDIAKQRHSLV